MSTDESKLMRKAQTGNIAATTKLLRRHYQQMYTVAYAYVHNQADALDVIQEASYRVVTHLDKLRDPSLFQTWLTRIVINEAVRLLQTQTKQATSVLPDSLPNQDPDPSTRLVIAEALAKLPEHYATVLRLHVVTKLPSYQVNLYQAVFVNPAVHHDTGAYSIGNNLTQKDAHDQIVQLAPNSPLTVSESGTVDANKRPSPAGSITLQLVKLSRTEALKLAQQNGMDVQHVIE